MSRGSHLRLDCKVEKGSESENRWWLQPYWGLGDLTWQKSYRWLPFVQMHLWSTLLLNLGISRNTSKESWSQIHQAGYSKLLYYLFTLRKNDKSTYTLTTRIGGQKTLFSALSSSDLKKYCFPFLCDYLWLGRPPCVVYNCVVFPPDRAATHNPRMALISKKKINHHKPCWMEFAKPLALCFSSPFLKKQCNILLITLLRLDQSSGSESAKLLWTF